jgi:hypothetical protein
VEVDLTFTVVIEITFDLLLLTISLKEVVLLLKETKWAILFVDSGGVLGCA